MAGYYDTIHLSFMIVGHTKFSPDWCFGLLKQKLRQIEMSCLDDMAQHTAVVNEVQLVGTQEG